MPSRGYPFTLGIASGDPLPTAVVIWTRLAPSPYEVGGGLGRRSHPVRWQVAEDPDFRRVRRQGTSLAHPEFSHTVHVDVEGLEPSHEYWYRFIAGNHISPVGRTVTAPAEGAHLAELNVVVASCQSLGAGWYHAWKDVVADPPDLVYFAGDYIYEYAIRDNSVRWPYTPPLPEDYDRNTDTLDRFRQQYALYKSDPDLKLAHQTAPWMVTWDDHEVVNDYDAFDPELFALRAAGYRAFAEHMPIRWPRFPDGHRATLYRSLTYGDLAQFHIVDTRQHRSTPHEQGTLPDIPERHDPQRQMLGEQQEQWLYDSLGSAGTTWDVLCNSVLLGRLDTEAGPGRLYSAGGWDAYAAAQQRLLDTVTAKDLGGFVVLNGDIHRNYHLNLHAEPEDFSSPVIGVEFAGTSISSGGEGRETDDGLEIRKAENPHLIYSDLWRGYLRCRITHDDWETQVRRIEGVQLLDYTASTSARLVTVPGDPGLVQR